MNSDSAEQNKRLITERRAGFNNEQVDDAEVTSFERWGAK
jgi:hypothetical protein